MQERTVPKEGLNCPTCRVTLTMTERQGIEIDYCPNCRGIWLDRGELDKIIERSSAPDDARGRHNEAPPPGAPAAAYPSQPQYQDQGYGHHGSSHGQRRRKSWLSEIFD